VRIKRPQIEAFTYWWTVEERSHDRRTGTYAVIGAQGNVWRWQVSEHYVLQEGVSKSQKGARAACRKFVRTLPDKETK